jgi:hypothetical protein
MLYVLLLSCAGPVTNAFLEEDQLFVQALPSREMVEVDARSAPVNDLQESAAQLNETVTTFLQWVEALQALPPTHRSRDTRGWGPYPVDSVPSWTWQAEIVRDEPGSYRWEFSLDTGSGAGPQPFFRGESVAGYTTTESDGAFTYDADVFNDLGQWQGWEGLLEVTFDYISDHRLTGAVSGQSYGYEADDEQAWFWYSAKGDIDDGEAEEDILVASRWELSGGGRSDSHYSGGDLAPDTYIQTRCWDDEGTITHEALRYNDTVIDRSGDAGSCVFDEVVTAR